MKTLACALPLALLGTSPPEAPLQDPAPDDEARAQLVATLAAAGVDLDFERRCLSIDVRVLVKHDLLEYLLVGPGGASHESLLSTEVQGSVIHTALLALGLEPGKNAEWVPRDPPPTDEERRQGASPYDVRPPEGDGVLPYLAWREGGDTYFYRVEDLVANLQTNRAMRRHRWVFLGSRFIEVREGEPEVFAADFLQNLMSVSYFPEGNALFTAALEECADQTIWLANAWLVPPSGSELRLVLALDPLTGPTALGEDFVDSLPVVVAPPADPGGRR